MLKEISFGIPKPYKVSAKRFKIPEVSKIDNITENITINPPIKRIVEIDFFIEEPKISPISEIFNGASLELNFVSL